jgi:hypothetical protein
VNDEALAMSSAATLASPIVPVLRAAYGSGVCHCVTAATVTEYDLLNLHIINQYLLYVAMWGAVLKKLIVA